MTTEAQTLTDASQIILELATANRNHDFQVVGEFLKKLALVYQERSDKETHQ